jgi:hypothetical protein
VDKLKVAITVWKKTGPNSSKGEEVATFTLRPGDRIDLTCSEAA